MSRIKTTLSALALLCSITSALAAPTVLVDRGLPGANLNNAAGANRSNVAWLEGDYVNANTAYTVLGDTFTNTSAQAWSISTITVWVVGNFTTASLLGGVSTGAQGLVSSSYTSSVATYTGGSTYQGSGGSDITMTQVNFAVSLLLGAGETFNFFLDGTGNPTYTLPFMHASNAALSGTTQAGSNDLMLTGTFSGGSITGISTWTSAGNGWDKASDFNVVVTGEAVPEPASLALVGVALFGAAATRRRRS